MHPDLDFTRSGAVIGGEQSEFRYLLWRKDEVLVGARVGWMLFVMLNPSTADASVDDPTIRKCREFARLHNRDLVVANLYAYRATDPADLKAAGYPVGPDNARYLKLALDTLSPLVVLAWGAKGSLTSEVREVLSGRGLWCLGRTNNGQPKHPLYLSYATWLEPCAPRAWGWWS